jgi:hypothetical protein
MEEEKRLKYRLYVFVPYNVSDIQKGIQAGHVALEYANLYGNTDAYQSFIKHDKTWIVLNGGTTRGETFSRLYPDGLGSLDEISKSLSEEGIPHAKFFEPDLNFALTGVCFLADERVWDYKSYPDFEDVYWEAVLYKHFSAGRTLTRQELIEKYSKQYSAWVDEYMGCDENVFLRELIRDKKLA